MANPAVGEIWQFKQDANPKNQKYWGALVEIVGVTPADVTYKWKDKLLRNPGFPIVSRTLVAFLNKFDGPVGNGIVTGNSIVTDADVDKLIEKDKAADPAAAAVANVPVTKHPSCSVCTDDRKTLQNGICPDCRTIRSLLKQHGKQYSAKDYYGIDPGTL